MSSLNLQYILDHIAALFWVSLWGLVCFVEYKHGKQKNATQGLPK